MKAYVNTVLGKVSADDLGKTYIHEHVYVKPNELPEFYDYTLDSVEKSIEELSYFKAAGGTSMVDLSPLNYGRNPEALRDMAKASSVHLMCVTGFHKEEFLPSWFYQKTDAEIVSFLRSELFEGIGYSKVLPAAIKIGTSKDAITDSEQRAIKLAANAAQDAPVPFITHCDKGCLGLEQIDLLGRYGIDPTRICLSHVDLPLNKEYLANILSTGASISFDHVGRELATHDRTRIEILAYLVDRGFEDQICLAGDMGKKNYFKAYGGTPGLDYILTDFKKWTEELISPDVFNKMVEDNPKRVLTSAL